MIRSITFARFVKLLVGHKDEQKCRMKLQLWQNSEDCWGDHAESV